jgi:hypothetical protein
MTIKEIIKAILWGLSALLSLSLTIISMSLETKTWALIAIIVNCIVAVVWLIEGLSNYYIYSSDWSGEKTYHIGHNDSPLRGAGLAMFCLMLWMAWMSSMPLWV